MFFQQYRVIADLTKQNKTGLDLREGQIVDVIEKLETGELEFEKMAFFIYFIW
jgi:hypothetical protein